MADYNSTYTGAQIDSNLAKAATAVQPAGLATVATTGAYTDLTGRPTLGTAAATASTDYATAAQGALADTAVQPADDAADLGSGSATDGYVLTADGAGGAAWEAASGGGGTPGGTDTQVQFNDGGAFGGDSGFTFDKTNNTLGLGGGTITASDPIIDMAQTWNNGAVAFTALKANVTDTASAAGSLLMDLQVGGVSQFSVRKDGRLVAGLFSNQMIFSPAERSLMLQNGAGVSNGGIRYMLGSSITMLAGTGYSTTHVDNGMVNSATGFVGWHGSVYSWETMVPDLRLHRDAANTLAQRNGVNAQAFNLYNTYTDASNYERGFMRWAGNELQIGTQKLGTGAARALVFQTDGALRMTIGAASGVTFNSQQIDNGNFRVTPSGNGMAVGGAFAISTSGLSGAVVYGSGYLGFGSGIVSTTSAPDLTLWRDAADILAQRNGTTAQTSRIYGTFTDASNYRRLTKTMSTAGVAEIKPEGAGTGASGNVLHISGLPTSNPGPGILWNNAGTPAIGT